MPVDMNKAIPLPLNSASVQESEITNLDELESVIEGASEFSFAEMNAGTHGSFPHRAYLFWTLGLCSTDPKPTPDLTEDEVIAALIRFGNRERGRAKWKLIHSWSLILTGGIGETHNIKPWATD